MGHFNCQFGSRISPESLLLKGSYPANEAKICNRKGCFIIYASFSMHMSLQCLISVPSNNTKVLFFSSSFFSPSSCSSSSST